VFPENAIKVQQQLAKVEAYLNSFRTLKARFTQLNPDGSQASGMFYLWRPGRMRLSYEGVSSTSPSMANKHILVANGDTIYDHDPERDETTEIPVDATPASFILREKIRFDQDIQVIRLEEKQGLLFLSLVKRDDPEAGTLTLVFHADPLTLIEWEIIDAQRLSTRVLLDAIETGVILDPNLFKINF
jgi:outer membrane lipoprotein-sorting protein